MLSDQSSIIIYRPENTSLEVAIRADREGRNVWGTQKQIGELLGLGVPTVNHHIQRFKEQRGERADRSIRQYRILAEDGKMRSVEHYDLTVIAFVGFQAKATERVMAFQDWVGDQLDQLGVPYRSTLTPAEQLLESAKQLVEHERAIAAIEAEQAEQDRLLNQHDQRLTTLETVSHIDEEYVSIRGYCSLHKIRGLSDTERGTYGRKATKKSRERGFTVYETHDAKWGKLNLYHKSILDEVMRGILPPLQKA